MILIIYLKIDLSGGVNNGSNFCSQLNIFINLIYIKYLYNMIIKYDIR